MQILCFGGRMVSFVVLSGVTRAQEQLLSQAGSGARPSEHELDLAIFPHHGKTFAADLGL